jgi:hypothetical protein
VVPTYVSTQRVEEPVENKLENLQGMDKLLDTYNHPTWNQEDINHLSRSITCNVTETAVNSLPKKKSPGLMVSPLNSTKLLGTTNTSISQNFSMK